MVQWEGFRPVHTSGVCTQYQTMLGKRSVGVHAHIIQRLMHLCQSSRPPVILGFFGFLCRYSWPLSRWDENRVCADIFRSFQTCLIWFESVLNLIGHRCLSKTMFCLCCVFTVTVLLEDKGSVPSLVRLPFVHCHTAQIDGLILFSKFKTIDKQLNLGPRIMMSKHLKDSREK